LSVNIRRSISSSVADGQLTVGEVVEAGVGAQLFGVAGFGGDGDMLGGVVVVHGVGLGGLRRRGVARLVGEIDGCEGDGEEGGEEERDRAAHADWIMLSKEQSVERRD
jgi:hypothetical protein